MADQFNTDFARALLGNATNVVPGIMQQAQRANQAVPDIAKQLGNFERFGGQAALAASTPGTAYGHNVAQAAGINNLLGALTPGAGSVWANRQNPMEGLVKQAALQTEVNKQLASGPMALAEMGLKQAEIGQKMVSSPMNLLIGGPREAQVPYHNISNMMGTGMNAINSTVANLDRAGVTGMAKFQALNQLGKSLENIAPGLPMDKMIPAFAESPKAVAQSTADEQKFGLVSTPSTTPGQENEAYMKMRNEAAQVQQNYERVMQSYDTYENMFGNMSKGAVTTQVLPAIFQRFVVDPTQTYINPTTGKQESLRDAGFVGGNDPAAIQKNLDLMKAQPSLARGVFAGITDANGNHPFTPEQINQIVDTNGTFNPDAAKAALAQSKEQAMINRNKANVILSPKMADVMANNNLQGANGKVFSAGDVMNKLYNYAQDQKSLVKKQFKPILDEKGRVKVDPAEVFEDEVNRSGDVDKAYQMIQANFPKKAQ
jgi:hypothetical protein